MVTSHYSIDECFTGEMELQPLKKRFEEIAITADNRQEVKRDLSILSHERHRSKNSRPEFERTDVLRLGLVQETSLLIDNAPNWMAGATVAYPTASQKRWQEKIP
jgi:hypothetical protein